MTVAAATDVDECSDYTKLGGSHRSITFYSPYMKHCDDFLKPGWYRFQGMAGRMMPTKCIAKFHCGAYAPGWLDGEHPMPQDGKVLRRVCFHLEGECCKLSMYIHVRNCGDFMVYNLRAPPKCPLKFCGNEIKGEGECVTGLPSSSVNG